MAKYKSEFDAVLIIFKALSDSNRLRLYMALEENEVCVCHLTDMLNLAPSTVSKHLSILKQANLIESIKKGKWIYYFRSKESSLREDSSVTQAVINSLQNDHQTKKDTRRLKKVMEVS